MPETRKKALSPSNIENVQDITLVEVEVPEWGGVVYIRSLSGKERDHFDSIYFNQDIPFIEKFKNARARFLVTVLCNENGEQLLKPEQVEMLGNKNGAVLDRLFEKAQEISGLRKKDIDKMGKDLSNDQT